MGFDLGGIVGGGLGALLGGSDASSGPAGYTTTTANTTQDLPAWLKPYLQSNLDGSQALRDSLTGGSPLLGASGQEMTDTISGKYLSPDSNPYLEATGQAVAGQIGRSVNSLFEGSGRYGSGANQDLLATNVGKALTSLYGTNYQAERGRQAAAAAGTPSYLSGATSALFSPYSSFNSLIPNLRDSSTATTSPYFRNKGAGILGGALAGSQLGSMFGDGLGGLGSLFGGGGAAGESLIGGFGEAAGGAGAAEGGSLALADLWPMLLAA